MHNGLPMIDRLKYSFSGLPVRRIRRRHAGGLSRLLDAARLDAVLVTSQDEYVTEYLPLANNALRGVGFSTARPAAGSS